MHPDSRFLRVANGRTDLIAEIVSSEGRGPWPEVEGAGLPQWAAYYGDVSALRLLLDHGSALSDFGEDLGLTAAAFHGHWQLCQFLIEQGANANYTDPATGETPLHAALTNEDRMKYDLVIKVLLLAGADPNARTAARAPTGSFMRDSRTRGEAPLHRAAAFGTPGTIKLLLDSGADAEQPDCHGDTPLAWASWYRRPVEVLRLLVHGEHRIHPAYKTMRENLLGAPMANVPTAPSFDRSAGERRDERHGSSLCTHEFAPRADLAPPILQSIHPVLMSRDVPASISFYALLGFSLTFQDSPSTPTYAAVARDGVTLHLQWHAQEPCNIEHDRPTYRFVADDVDQLFAAFRASGAVRDLDASRSPWASPGDTPWGTREFHVRDPDGNGLQFYGTRSAGGGRQGA